MGPKGRALAAAKDSALLTRLQMCESANVASPSNAGARTRLAAFDGPTLTGLGKRPWLGSMRSVCELEFA